MGASRSSIVMLATASIKARIRDFHRRVGQFS